MNLSDMAVKNMVAIVAAGALAAVLFMSYSPPRASDSGEGGAEACDEWEVEVVRTEEERARGLSGRQEVPRGYGMLFVFDAAGRYGLWMRDMLVPIDIVWLADDGSVVGVEREVTPETFPRVFYPPSPVRYVLETASGEAARCGWEVGERVPVHLPE